MKFTLSAPKQEANDTFSFIFAPEQPLQWKAGQLLRYVLNHPNPDDRGVERFFSIASAPHEKHVMLTTRFAPTLLIPPAFGLVGVNNHTWTGALGQHRLLVSDCISIQLKDLN